MPQGRRANNEGTIVQRSDGRWCGAVSLPDGTRKWVYGRTRRDVADRMKAILRELQQGVLPAPENLTVQDVLEQWLTEGARMSVRASTFRSYSDIVRLHWSRSWATSGSRSSSHSTSSGC